MNTTFAQNLHSLPEVGHIRALELLDANQQVLATIANQPGSAGSVRVYAALAAEFGCIHALAAERGLALYAEHTEDARLHPGKHPNIDRLLAIRNTDSCLWVRPLG